MSFLYSYMQKSIDKNFTPITKEVLRHKFSQLGIKQGDTLLAHASLSSLGYVVGGAEALFFSVKGSDWKGRNNCSTFSNS